MFKYQKLFKFEWFLFRNIDINQVKTRNQDSFIFYHMSNH